VTGASRGIGLATARTFLERGWNVVATMRSPDPSILPSSERMLVTRLDLLDRESIRSSIASAVERFGGVDVLINNAAMANFGPIDAFGMEVFEEQIAVNVLGTMDVTREVLPLMRTKGGTIINISSLLGRVGVPLMSPYVASKFAIEGFTEALEMELRPLGIKVRLIEPGPVATGMVRDAVERGAGRGEYVGRVRDRTLARRGVPPARVARAIYRAAIAKGGRMRYPVGAISRILLILRKIFPHSMLEWIIATGTGG
jgi:NAD(P)-dependent dehydrogenase (short-subunit alcohol dehydrogenase family)